MKEKLNKVTVSEIVRLQDSHHRFLVHLACVGKLCNMDKHQVKYAPLPYYTEDPVRTDKQSNARGEVGSRSRN